MTFKILCRFVNFPEELETWKEIESITSSLRMESPEGESELLCQMFQHMPQDLQHRLLIMTADNSEDTMEHCKLLLLLLKRFPGTVSTHGVKKFPWNTFPEFTIFFVSFMWFPRSCSCITIYICFCQFSATSGGNPLNRRKTQPPRTCGQRLPQSPGLRSSAPFGLRTRRSAPKTESPAPLQGRRILPRLHPTPPRKSNIPALESNVPHRGINGTATSMGAVHTVRSPLEPRALQRTAQSIRQQIRGQIARRARGASTPHLRNRGVDQDIARAQCFAEQRRYGLQPRPGFRRSDLE